MTSCHAPRINPQTGHREGCVCTPCAAFDSGMTVEEFRAFVQETRTPEYQARAWDRLSRSVYDSACVEPENAVKAHTSRPAAPASRPAAGPSEKQAAFIRTLVSERPECGITDVDALLPTLTPGRDGTASGLITSLLAMPKGTPAAAPKAAAYSTPTPTVTVPAGRYAVTSRTGNNDLDFYKVDAGKGRWAGRTFVSRVIGGHPDFTLRGAEADAALTQITDAGVEAAGLLYGQTIGRCCRCNHSLTDESSRAAGIGPECATKGW